jgi:pimeloyl-ACP methyl ester carboxylesterase
MAWVIVAVFVAGIVGWALFRHPNAGGSAQAAGDRARQAEVDSEIQGARAPNDTESQWVSRDPAHPHEVALVFIHGIFGSTLSTWANAGGTHFYDLIRQDPKFGDRVDLFAFGFPSKMVEGGSFDIQEAANALLAELQNKGVSDYRRVVFVAHSMGGLVALRALLTERALLPKVPLIVFLATPQEGAAITLLARKVIANPALEEMLPGDMDGYLYSMDQDWHSIDVGHRPHISCAYEKLAIFGVMIVSRLSATRFCEGTSLAVEADHIGIAKPENMNSGGYVAVSNALASFVFAKGQ